MDLSSTEPDFDYLFTNVMCLHHVFLKEAYAWFDRLRATRRRIIAEGYGAEAKCCTLFAKTGAGKSKIVKSYVSGPVVDYCYDQKLFTRDTPRDVVAALQRKVMYVSVSGTATLMSLLEDLLRAFGDPRPQRGNLGSKKERILNYIREFGTELLIFDEMNHLKIGSSNASMRSEATRVHNTLKDFLLGGCPIIFAGTEEAETKVFSDLQIRDRCVKQLFLGPLLSGNAKHYESYKEFCGLLGLELKRLGIFPDRSNFLHPRTVAALFEASGKYYGHTANIIAEASRLAYEEGVTKVEWDHLSRAADEYTVFNRLCRDNPFTRGRPASEAETKSAEAAIHA
ncbi:TniB family NTP-binding protein [Rhizobium laguerreae]|uniref:TniB family NTP-binding protein n=1 Tax=Rhizobium laguerreae TaxID=1076926 RepID=UPI001C90A185|nr:TniB family NTP-binding protein [Rhizobium laguerreae]MBY3568952.1 AAA family ATPase [Rhizobium laguerreae]